MSTQKTVPVYILTGYLGAGKTTLLQTLLQHYKQLGQRPAVLMNEFGSVSVDTLLLESNEIPVVELLDGCICCTLKGSIHESITEILDHNQPDVLFIETTGVASPVDLVAALLVPDLQEKVKLSGVFTLVSAKRFPVDLADQDQLTVNEKTMIEQVQHSDVLLVSKTDLVAPERVAELEHVLHGLNAKAPLLKVVKGAIDPAALLSVQAQQRSQAIRKPKGFARRTVGSVSTAVREKPTSFGNLKTFYYEFQNPVDPDKLFRLLFTLPETVLRAKGFFVNAESSTLSEFHYVGPNQVTVGDQAFLHGKSFALFIGEDLNEASLASELQTCEVVRL